MARFTKKSGLSVLLACAFGFLAFQNCAENKYASSTYIKAEAGEATLNSSDVTPDPHKELPVYVHNTQVNQMPANRILTANFFISIFGSSVVKDATALVAQQPGDFGSSFSIYDLVRISDSKACGAKADIYTPCIPVAFNPEGPSNIGLNIRREAFRIRLCHKAVDKDAHVLHALRKIDSKAQLKSLPVINEAHLDKAYQLFFRAKPLPDRSVIDALTIVGQSQEDEIDKWKAILLTLCLSPHWQVL